MTERPDGVLAGVLYDARDRWLNFYLCAGLGTVFAVFFADLRLFYVGVAVFFAATPTLSVGDQRILGGRLEDGLSEVAP